MKSFGNMLVAALFALLGVAQTPGIRQPNAELAVVVVEGQRSVNILDSGATVVPVVELRAKDGALVEGGYVTFTMPRREPKAVFPGDKDVLSVATDHFGRASAVGMRPVGIGEFEIFVLAEYRGQSASTMIRQANVLATGDAVAAQKAFGDWQPAASARIQILAGDDGVNIINKNTAVKSVVRVLDKNNLPVAGVAVTITILAMRGGAKTEFAGSKNSVTVTTDANGQAEVASLRPHGKGSFQIEIQATFEGQKMVRQIRQTNFPNIAAAQKAGKAPGSSAPPEGASSTSTETASDQTSGNSAEGANGSSTPAATGSSTPAATGSSAPAASASSTPAAVGGTAATVGGMTAGKIGLIALTGLVATGSIAKAAGLLDDNTSKRADCTPLVNKMITAMTSSDACTGTARDPATQCRIPIQNALNEFSQACSCAGGLNGFSAEVRSRWSQLADYYSQLGFNTNVCR